MTIDPVEVVFKLLVWMSIVLLAWLFGFAVPLGVQATKECLIRGYPESRTTWDGEAYCIGRNSMGATVVVKLPI